MNVPGKRQAREDPPELVFVGGPERSGTTLLQNMLDCHPDICGAPEFMHLQDVMELRNKMRHSVERGWIDLFGTQEEVDEAIRDFVLGFFGRFREGHPSRILSEKTPRNVLVFEELLSLFDDARALFMVRDPRGVVASMLEVGKRAREDGREIQGFTLDLRKAIGRVRRCVESGVRASKLAPERLMTVRYEQLVRQPEEVTRDVCDFLSVPWSADMLRPESQEHAGEKATVNDVWYDLESYYSPPDPSRIDRWKVRLSPAQKVAVSRAFAGDPHLAELGYDDFELENLELYQRTLGTSMYFARRVTRPVLRRLAR